MFLFVFTNRNKTLNASDYYITVGLHDRRRGMQGPHTKIYKVQNIILHEQFNETKSFDNDIAVLRIEENITFNDHVIPVCLPQQDVEIKGYTYIVGWGAVDG